MGHVFVGQSLSFTSSIERFLLFTKTTVRDVPVFVVSYKPKIECEIGMSGTTKQTLGIGKH